jgi:type II secretory pathway predicted ATPase ExeA
MYLDHFNLREKPFKISTDPRFLWLGGKHKEALATVRDGILYQDGFVVVTGDVGTGKTTLATALIDELGDQVIAVKVPYPGVDILDFLRLISAIYGIADDFHSKGAFLVRFEAFLRSSFAEGKKVVLIIDEAQTLSSKHLEELLHLSNIEQDGERILNIVFVGQNEFNGILTEESNRALRQRVAINCNLDPLTEDETRDYILHRLKVAQCDKDVFSAEAIQHVFRYSQGIPRLINIVCELALLLTYFEGGKVVEGKTIELCVLRLRLPAEHLEVPWNNALGFLSEGERKAGEEDSEGIRSEVAGTPIEKNVRKPLRLRVVVGVAFGLALFLFGLALLVYRQVNVRQTSTYAEPKTEATQPKDGRQNKTGVHKAEDVSRVPSASRTDQRLSGAGRGDLEQVARPKKPGAAEKRGKAEGAVASPVRTGDEQSAGSPALVRPAEEGSSGVLHEKGSPSEEEHGPSGKGKAVPAETGETLASPPESSAEGSRQGTAGQEAQGMEPDKLIEWVLQKHSQKQ